jgi:hypothetical protein
MELPGLLVTGGLSVAASVVTAYLTARLQGRNERRKWQRELALLQAERQASNPDVAQTVAQHYATAYVITPDREKYFLMPGTTLSIGRENTSSDIRLSSPLVSRRAGRLRSTDHDVFLIDVGSTLGLFVNGQRVGPQKRLKDGDIIHIAPPGQGVSMEFHFIKEQW